MEGKRLLACQPVLGKLYDPLFIGTELRRRTEGRKLLQGVHSAVEHEGIHTSGNPPTGVGADHGDHRVYPQRTVPLQARQGKRLGRSKHRLYSRKSYFLLFFDFWFMTGYR